MFERISEYLYADGGFDFTYDKEWNELSDLLADQIKSLIEAHAWIQWEKS